MRLCRFTLKADPERKPRLGLLADDGVRDVTAVTEELPSFRWPLPLGDQVIANLSTLRPRMEAMAGNAPAIARSEVSLLSPVANPGKIICGAGNWRHHGIPLGTLGTYFKAVSALAGEGDGVELRWLDRETVYEAELAWVIGRECTNVSEAEAADCIAGFTCGLDMTLKVDGQAHIEDWTFVKSFDTYGMLGPALVTSDEIGDPAKMSMKLWVNDVLREEWGFDKLTAQPAQMVSYVSTIMTLHPGDIVFSGTPNTDVVKPGDVMSMEIPQIGRIDVPVRASAHARTAPPSYPFPGA